jgi:hypothetical protein
VLSNAVFSVALTLAFRGAVRPVLEIQPFRTIYATRLHGRRVPAVASMVRCLTDAATTRLG